MRVSHSELTCYKRCRRLYFLKYKEGLRYNKPIEALENGTSYHAKLEDIYNKGYFDNGLTKIDAMASAYEKYIYPNFAMKSVEQWFEKPISKSNIIFGRVDGIATDGLIVEHKTTSGDIDEAYIFALQFDEQILTYMLGNDVNEMYYTVCKKPTIRQKQNETSEEYYDRCCEWFAEDTDKKIRVLKVTRNKKEIDEFKKITSKTITEMASCKCFYKNVSQCMSYGRQCEYAQICLTYDPTITYVDFDKKEKKEVKEKLETEVF